jgi:hypothetical protein
MDLELRLVVDQHSIMIRFILTLYSLLIPELSTVSIVATLRWKGGHLQAVGGRRRSVPRRVVPAARLLSPPFPASISWSLIFSSSSS